MNELYGYLSRIMAEMHAGHKTTAEIDMEHLFKAFRVVCHMMQIRSIVNFDEDVVRALESAKAVREAMK